MLKSTRSQLLFFFTLSFILAWASWIPVFLNPNIPSALSFVGLFAPAISALVTATLSENVETGSQILKKIFRFRFGARWYALVIFVMPLAYLLAVVLNIAFFHFSAAILAGNSPLFILISFVWLMFVTSGEEIGWRGFALPKLLEELKSPLAASLAIGAIWAIWHLPVYLIPGQAAALPYPIFFALTLGLSIVYTALSIKAKGSLLPAILLHAGTDIGPRIFQFTNFTPAIWMTTVIIVLIVATILIRDVSSAKTKVELNA